YFAIPPDFPPEHVPAQTGLIVADRYGGAIVKPAEAQALHASRRKAVTISFAKTAAERLSAILDTIGQTSSPNLVIPNAADES
ncbi:MAG: MmcB family DNA repair protein, partial [Rhizomicrobium sp.]